MKWLVLTLALLVGCAKPTPPVVQPAPEPVKVIVVKGSDPVPEKLRKHIIARTNQFCQVKYKVGVKQVKIFHSGEKKSTWVLYQCRSNNAN